MRNIFEVIREKESAIQEIQKELEALRFAARLLADDGKGEAETPKMRMAGAGTPASMAAPASIKTDTEVVLSAPHRSFP